MTPPAAGNIRPAASLLMLRDGPRGVEVLLMRRPERDNDFRSGACVFPGGVLDRADAQAHALCLGLDDATASARLGLPQGGLDYFIAAVRESFEEVGLLFACQADGQPIDVATHAAALRDWRSRLHRGEASIAELCGAQGWRIDLRDMAYVAHWLTPVTRPKRFDTRFFVRVAPAGQQAMPDFGEALELLWLTPDEALDPQRGLKLLNVTQKVLHSIRDFTSAQAGFERALALRGVPRIFPRPALGRDGMRFVIDGDAAYAEVAYLDPDGRGDVRCDLSPGDVVQLSPRLWRVSGSRSNAYVVADPGGSGRAVIDANTDDAAQLQSLARLAGGAVSVLLFTEGNSAEAVALGAAGEALRSLWPAAHPPVWPESGEPPVQQLGAGSTLQALRLSTQPPSRLFWRLDEEATLIGGDAAAAPDARALRALGIEWWAPGQGFLMAGG
jgi:8-oxo-dGTP pyrophosphatase MutT (NUDIX family)